MAKCGEAPPHWPHPCLKSALGVKMKRKTGEQVRGGGSPGSSAHVENSEETPAHRTPVQKEQESHLGSHPPPRLSSQSPAPTRTTCPSTKVRCSQQRTGRCSKGPVRWWSQGLATDTAHGKQLCQAPEEEITNNPRNKGCLPGRGPLAIPGVKQKT